MDRMASLKEVLDANPQIDRELLQRSIHVAKELAERGVRRRGYTLQRPDSVRKVHVDSLLSAHMPGEA